MPVENNNTVSPDFIIYAQHGWADTNVGMARLAKTLATPKTLTIAPNLGFFRTWFWIEPLIKQVESNFIETIKIYPHTPIKIIGHSMGGLIWLEILDRNPQWWNRIHSLVLLGSPIGGSDLARIVDPLRIGIGIAKDLGIDRRAIATKIAQAIPTLVIAGDTDNGSDGVVTVESTKFFGSKFVSLSDVFHPALRNHPDTIESIRNFWQNPVKTPVKEGDFTIAIVERLRSTPGITDAHRRDFYYSKSYLTFNNGIGIRTWKNPVGINHVFIADREEEYLWGGFVGWLHNTSLNRTLQQIKQEYSDLIQNK